VARELESAELFRLDNPYWHDDPVVFARSATYRLRGWLTQYVCTGQHRHKSTFAARPRFNGQLGLLNQRDSNRRAGASHYEPPL